MAEDTDELAKIQDMNEIAMARARRLIDFLRRIHELEEELLSEKIPKDADKTSS